MASTNIYPLFYDLTSSEHSALWLRASRKLAMKITYDPMLNKTAYAVIEYTKTTD